jgi:hypothetical protein
MKKLILIISIIFLSSCNDANRTNYCAAEPLFNNNCFKFAANLDSKKAYKECCWSLPTYEEFLRNK